jgi:ligand-binding sensor domain-containing protein
MALAILFTFVVLTTAMGGSWIRYRILNARDRAAAESASSVRVPVTVVPVNSVPPGGSESIPFTPEFRDVSVWRDRLYLCGPGGLYSYDSAGISAQSYRTGRELPPGEPVAAGHTATELFIATSGAGVLVFDGNRFQQILPVDEHLRNFSSVLALSSGRVLLGTPNRGVLAWDGKTLEDFQPALKSANVTALAGSDADLWIGTVGDGVWRLHAGRLDHLSADLPDSTVLSIAVQGESAYVGTPVGVVEFREGRKARSLAEGYFARSLDADSESLAVGTEDEGIVTIPLAVGRLAQPPRASFALQSSVSRIFRLDGMRYALAGGLYRSESAATNWTRVLAPETGALNDRNVAALNIGHDGRVWVGYFDRGLDVADAGFNNVRHFEDEHLFCVNRIAEEPGGARTAVATANGLVMFDPSLTVRQILGHKDGLLADHVTDVLFRPGGMAVATPAGLSLVDSGGVRSLYVLQGLVNNHVYSLAASGERLAAGTLGGLSMLEGDAVSVNYTTANSGLKHNWISAMARVGDAWFAGTYGAGVMRLDASGHWTSLTPAFEVNPNAMAQANGVLYAGTLGKGLWIYSGRWRNVTAGLPSLNVTAVAAANGFVYVGTDNGLVRFREGSLR